MLFYNKINKIQTMEKLIKMSKIYPKNQYAKKQQHILKLKLWPLLDVVF